MAIAVLLIVGLAWALGPAAPPGIRFAAVWVDSVDANPSQLLVRVAVTIPGGRVPNSVQSVTVTVPGGGTFTLPFDRSDLEVEDSFSLNLTQVGVAGFPAGTYTFTVTDVSGGVSLTADDLAPTAGLAPPTGVTLSGLIPVPAAAGPVNLLNPIATPTPTVGWTQAPGTVIQRVRVRPGLGDGDLFAAFVGADVSSLTLPAGVLVPGRRYVVSVEAFDHANGLGCSTAGCAHADANARSRSQIEVVTQGPEVFVSTSGGTGPGQTFSVTSRINNTGPAVTVKALAWIGMPTGGVLNLVDLGQVVIPTNLDADFFNGPILTYVFTGSEPAGNYVVGLRFTDAGTGQTVALATKSFAVGASPTPVPSGTIRIVATSSGAPSGSASSLANLNISGVQSLGPFTIPVAMTQTIANVAPGNYTASGGQLYLTTCPDQAFTVVPGGITTLTYNQAPKVGSAIQPCTVTAGTDGPAAPGTIRIVAATTGAPAGSLPAFTSLANLSILGVQSLGPFTSPVPMTQTIENVVPGNYTASGGQLYFTTCPDQTFTVTPGGITTLTYNQAPKVGSAIQPCTVSVGAVAPTAPGTIRIVAATTGAPAGSLPAFTNLANLSISGVQSFGPFTIPVPMTQTIENVPPGNYTASGGQLYFTTCPDQAFTVEPGTVTVLTFNQGPKAGSGIQPCTVSVSTSDPTTTPGTLRIVAATTGAPPGCVPFCSTSLSNLSISGPQSFGPFTSPVPMTQTFENVIPGNYTTSGGQLYFVTCPATPFTVVPGGITTVTFDQAQKVGSTLQPCTVTVN